MIVTRSPYYYNVEFLNDFVTQVDFELSIGTGSLSSIDVVKTYNFSKLKPSEDSLNTWIDLSPYIRDFYNYSPIPTGSISSPTIISSEEVLLAIITAQQIDSLGSELTVSSSKYKCTDGYGYYTEGQNPDLNKSILLSHNDYKAYENGYFIVPIECSSSSSNPTVEGVEVALNYAENATNYVKYLIIPLGGYSGNVEVVYNGESINIELIEECKYPINEVQFLNKFGVIEQVHFYKAAKETLNTKSESFKNAFTNGVSYDTQRHQSKQYNKISNKKIKIETGYLNPYYNQTMQELMESEYVWINGIPVNVSSSNLEFKTRIVDKLISYSIDFEYAFDEINNV